MIAPPSIAINVSKAPNINAATFVAPTSIIAPVINTDSLKDSSGVFMDYPKIPLVLGGSSATTGSVPKSIGASSVAGELNTKGAASS